MLVYVPVLIALTLSTVLAIITPRDFPASAKVMPSSANSSSGSLGALIPGAAMITQAAMQVNLYLELLKSTQVRDSVLAHYGAGLKGGAFLSSMLPSGYSASAICEAVTEAAFSSKRATFPELRNLAEYLLSAVPIMAVLAPKGYDMSNRGRQSRLWRGKPTDT